MIVLSQNETREIILDPDSAKPPEAQTVFVLGPPHPRRAYAVNEAIWALFPDLIEITEGSDRTTESASVTMRKLPLPALLKAGQIVLPAMLRGWRNLRDTKGAEVLWQADADQTGMNPDLLAYFTMATQGTLVMKATELLNLTEEEAKN